MPPNRIPENDITTDHKEEEQLEDQRNVGKNSCNCGDGTDQKVQSLMFMMMMIYIYSNVAKYGHGPPEDGFRGDRNMLGRILRVLV
jgi:hypothetical protein